MRFTAGGAAVTTLSLATSESWKDKESGQDQKKTEWHRVVLWNELAENAGEYFKGSKGLHRRTTANTKMGAKTGKPVIQLR